jgi:hypothetical protein
MCDGFRRYRQPMTDTPAVPMARRSWYLPADVAGRLAVVVDDLHYLTRRPKWEVLAAALGVAVDHRADILARLTHDGAA